MDFHPGHIKAVGVCPLCGEIITRTMQTEIQTGDELTYASYGRVGVTRRHEPTIQIKWMCAAGCTIEVRGQMPRGRNMNDEFFNGTQEVRIDTYDEPKALTGESLSSLTPKAQQAKQALEELEEGMKPDATRSDQDKV